MKQTYQKVSPAFQLAIPPLARTVRLAFISTAVFVYFSVLLVTLALNRAPWYQMADRYAVAEQPPAMVDYTAAQSVTQGRPLPFPQNKTVVRSVRASSLGNVLGVMSQLPPEAVVDALSATAPCECSSSHSSRVKPGLRLRGRILLQVEERGEAWYVDPDSSQAFYLADGQSAFQAFAGHAVGITNADIYRIPVGNLDEPEQGVALVKSQWAERLYGRILIQAESLGELWYVNPVDGRRYYLADGQAAYRLMERLGIGVTNNDLDRIRGSHATEA